MLAFCCSTRHADYMRDFFVESEYNIDLRDYGEEVTQRHYKAKGKDSYTDTSAMFSSLNIKAGNYYKYDTSLSISKIWYSFTDCERQTGLGGGRRPNAVGGVAA